MTTSRPTTPMKGNCWILHERARQYYWKGASQLSIKTFWGGRAHYQVGCGHHAVDESSYLVLNEGQSYSISIEAREPVESFCVFFAAGFVEEVQQSLAARPERLLGEPAMTSAPVRFFEKNYPRAGALWPALARLRRDHVQQESGEVNETFHDLAERLLKVHGMACLEMRRLSNVRAATREELYRRVCRARDYACAFFGESVTLADMARVACLSANHLLRTFREVFGQSPYQFVRTRRLEEAKRLLEEGDLPVTEICLEVGFESLGSFSTAFCKCFGRGPAEYRKQVILEKRRATVRV